MRVVSQPLCAGDTYQVGAGNADITPSDIWSGKYYLGGMAWRTSPATRVDKNLSARALAISGPGGTIIMLALDVTSIDAALVDRIRQHAVASHWVDGPEYVLVNVSHTHSAPIVASWPTYGPPYETPDPGYVALVEAGAEAAMAQAYQARALSVLSFGRTTSNIVYCRHPGSQCDATVDILRVASPDGATTRAVAFFAAAHPVLTAYDLAISPDYPGYARDQIEAQSDHPTALFFQSFGGNINATGGSVEQVGQSLATSVSSVLDGGNMSCLTGAIDARYIAEPVAFDPPLSTAALATIRDSGDTGWFGWPRWAMFQLRSQPAPTSLATEFQMLRIGLGTGSLRVAAATHEVTSDYGPKVRRLWPNDNVVTVGYSNAVDDYLPSYAIRTTPAFSFPDYPCNNYEGGSAAEVYSQPQAVRTDVEEHFLNMWDRLWPTREDCGTSLRVTANSSGSMYYADYDGRLRWYKYDGQQWFGPTYPGSAGWDTPVSVFSGDQGVVYLVDRNYNLQWYKHPDYQNGSGGMLGPVQVGYRWEVARHILWNGNGVIYITDGSAYLRWYKHLNWETGATPAQWYGPNYIGSGFTMSLYPQMFASRDADGVIYGIDSAHNLYWYRHTDPAGGATSWYYGGIRQLVRTGWDYIHSFAGGNGVIYTIDRYGDLYRWVHNGRQWGTQDWTGPTRVGIGWWAVVNKCMFL